MTQTAEREQAPVPVVQVIMLHLRGREMLERCLATLLNSTGVHLEIVLVLNDCQERLPDIAYSHLGIHPVETPGPLGFAEANNFGVEWALANLGRPDYYYFLNNDTESSADALERLIEALLEEGAAVAGPLLLIHRAERHLNSLGLNVTRDAWGWDEGIGQSLEDYGPLPARREVLAVTGSALLVTAAGHQEVGGWSEIYDYYFEDIDYCLKIQRRGGKVIHEPKASVLHRISATMSIGSETKFFLFRRNRLVLAFVHWPFRLLVRLLWRAVFDEIVGHPREETELERRGLLAALRKAPRALGLRLRLRGRRDWVEFLHPPGSVPPITLPDPYVEQQQPLEIDVATDDASSPELVDGGDERLDFDPVPLLSWLDGDRDARRVLVLGWSPLPFENTLMNFAPGVRSWQFAQPLARDGNLVCLVCARIPGTYPEGAPRLEVSSRDNVLILTLERDDFARGPFMPKLMLELQPDAVVGAAPVPSLRAVELADDLPLWVDTFGDPMAEAQAKSQAQGGSDNHALAYAQLLMRLLERGDCFSAVSERQRLALLGQLGLIGRLTAETVGYELVASIPCTGSYNPVVDAEVPEEARRRFAEDDFVVLWSGGFNTWCDVDVLVHGLERAMREDPTLHFLATGGAIEGHDTRTYSRFQQLVGESRYSERFVLLGTLPRNEADAWSRRADLGVVTEKRMVERELGSSGRILNWLTQGLPVVCTNLSELGEILEREGGALTYEVGDPSSLVEVLLLASRDETARSRIAARGRELAQTLWAAEVTTRSLRRWVRRAKRSPDAREKNPIFDVDLVSVNQRLGRENESQLAEVEARGRAIVELRSRVEQLEGESAHLGSQVEHLEGAAGHWQRRWSEAEQELARMRRPWWRKLSSRVSRLLS